MTKEPTLDEMRDELTRRQQLGITDPDATGEDKDTTDQDTTDNEDKSKETQDKDTTDQDTTDKEDKTTEEDTTDKSTANEDKDTTDKSTDKDTTDQDTTYKTNKDDSKDPYEKRYNDLRSRTDRVGTENATLKKSLEDMKKKFDEISRSIAQGQIDKEINAAELAQALQTRGVEALKPIIDKYMGPQVTQYKQQTDEALSLLTNTTIDLETKIRTKDKENYPYFEALNDEMTKLASSKEYPIDRKLSIGEQLDELYKLAMSTEEGKKVVNDLRKKRLQTKPITTTDEEGRVITRPNASRGKGSKTDLDYSKMTREEMRQELIQEQVGSSESETAVRFSW